MTNYRYPGIKPFQTEDKEVFFGRKTDTEKLFKLITVEKTVLLYSKSGLGKSSLLNAGIVPLIETQTNYLPISIRFYAYNPDNEISPLQSTLSKIEKLVSSFTYIDPFINEQASLWLYCKKYQIANPDKKLLLLFDQFEELFTYPEAQILEFKKQLAELLFTAVPQALRTEIKTQNEVFSREQVELLYTPMNTKTVFSIRSDRMALLNQLTDYIPNLQQVFYELKPLNDKQALEAIMIPAQKKGDFYSQTFDFQDDAQNQIIDFLSQHGKRKIESFQLQMICQHCENKIIEQKDLKSITAQNLGNIESLFNDYYENAIKSLDNESDRISARIFIEEKLIVDERRISLDKVLCLKSVNTLVLQRLTESRLLREEPNTTDSTNYELCHDTMVIPILESQKKREQENKIIETRRQAIKKNKRRLRNTIIVASLLLMVLVIGFSVQLYLKNQRINRINAEMAKSYVELSRLIFLELDNTGKQLPLYTQIEKLKISAIELSKMLGTLDFASKNETDQAKIVELLNKTLIEIKKNKIIQRMDFMNDSIKKNSKPTVLTKEKVSVIETKKDIPKKPNSNRLETQQEVSRQEPANRTENENYNSKKEEANLAQNKTETPNLITTTQIKEEKIIPSEQKDTTTQIDCYYFYKHRMKKEIMIPIRKEGVSKADIDYFLKNKPEVWTYFTFKDKFKEIQRNVNIKIINENKVEIYSTQKKVSSSTLFTKIPERIFEKGIYCIEWQYTLKNVTFKGKYSLKLEENAVKLAKNSKKLTATAFKNLATNVNFSSINSPSSKPTFEYEVVKVEGGTFKMGSNEEENEKPIHTVAVKTFSIGKYEVTQAQWAAIMDKNPSSFKNCPNCPVEKVSWKEIQTFLKKVKEKTGKTYRLPTEEEWEFAAQGGNKSKGFTYSGSNILADVAWYDKNGDSKTHPVGTKKANELGIFDMSGNVYEWCQDFYNAYSGNSILPDYAGVYRVLRGGSYRNFASGCRAVYRFHYPPNKNRSNIGFRLVLDK